VVEVVVLVEKGSHAPCAYTSHEEVPHPFTPIERGSEGEGKRGEKGREEGT